MRLNIQKSNLINSYDPCNNTMHDKKPIELIKPNTIPNYEADFIRTLDLFNRKNMLCWRN